MVSHEDIIRMAREADSYADKHGPSAWRHPDEFAAFRDEHFAALVAAAERDKSFRAGFMASGEGWNGEYPFQDNDRPVIGDPSVEAALTAALASKGDA